MKYLEKTLWLISWKCEVELHYNSSRGDNYISLQEIGARAPQNDNDDDGHNGIKQNTLCCNSYFIGQNVKTFMLHRLRDNCTSFVMCAHTRRRSHCGSSVPAAAL